MSYTKPLRHAVLEITNRCNLRCAHCASNSGEARTNELALGEWCRLLFDIRELGGEEITLLGGEPLLHPEWFKIAAAVGELGMRLVLISNGLLIDREETLARLMELRPHLIGISLDGSTAESYRQMRGVDGFDRIIGLLRRLLADGHPQVNAITTFTRNNLEEFDRFCDLLDNSGITWQIQLAHEGGERFRAEEFVSLEDFRWLAGKIRQAILTRPNLRLRTMDDFGYFPLDPALRFLHQTWTGCIAGTSLIGVRSNGDLLGCLSLGDRFIEGNLRENTLREFWTRSSSFHRFREKHRVLGGACAQCAFGSECKAGCSAIAYSATGNLGNNPYCIRALESADILTGFVDGAQS